MTIKDTAIRAAHAAGKVLLRLSTAEIKYTMKNAHDILAEADLQSEKIILSEIRKDFPDHSILSEEQGEDAKQSDFLWIVDPVDGTINYSRGIEEYCISIAVSKKNDLIFGLIYQPATGALWIAENGKGAFLNDTKITVSSEDEIINTILATDNSGKADVRRANFRSIANICDDVRHVRVMGSAALHLARLAAGSIDVYFKTEVNYWDCAAGVLLIREAGGVVTGFAGTDFGPDSKGIVASNGRLHPAVLEMLTE